jgi:(E)-4-hydroxy-3-methylbut-2-enyl-diphosphate synthase
MGVKGLVCPRRRWRQFKQGIADTIRVSLTPRPAATAAKRSTPLASSAAADPAPGVTACPGCGRTTSSTFQELAERIQVMCGSRCRREGRYEGVETISCRHGLRRQRPWRIKGGKYRD